MKAANVSMTRDGVTTDVANNASVGIMEGLGWKVDGSEGGKPSDGLTVSELKDALTAKEIEIPEGAKKAELAELLDAAE